MVQLCIATRFNDIKGTENPEMLQKGNLSGLCDAFYDLCARLLSVRCQYTRFNRN